MVEVVDRNIIRTLKQSAVCCSQIMTMMLPMGETIRIARDLNDVGDVGWVESSISRWRR